MSRSHPVAQVGFTLVEATIVLMIIGLVIGSMLWGQELVLNGRSKAVIIDMNEIAAAVASYQDRYRALPGDDPMAQSPLELDGGSRCRTFDTREQQRRRGL